MISFFPILFPSERSLLGQQWLDNLLMIYINSKSVSQFAPTTAIEFWLTRKNRYLNRLNVSKEREHSHSDFEEDASLNESSDTSDDNDIIYASVSRSRINSFTLSDGGMTPTICGLDIGAENNNNNNNNNNIDNNNNKNNIRFRRAKLNCHIPIFHFFQ